MVDPLSDHDGMFVAMRVCSPSRNAPAWEFRRAQPMLAPTEVPDLTATWCDTAVSAQEWEAFRAQADVECLWHTWSKDAEATLAAAGILRRQGRAVPRGSEPKLQSAAGNLAVGQDSRERQLRRYLRRLREAHWCALLPDRYPKGSGPTCWLMLDNGTSCNMSLLAAGVLQFNSSKLNFPTTLRGRWTLACMRGSIESNLSLRLASGSKRSLLPGGCLRTSHESCTLAGATEFVRFGMLGFLSLWGLLTTVLTLSSTLSTLAPCPSCRRFSASLFGVAS